MDALGYTGSVVVQIYRDVFYSSGNEPNTDRLAFFIDFSYLMAAIGLVLFLASMVYFLARTRKQNIKHAHS